MKIVVLVKQVPDTYTERTLDEQTGMLDRQASDAVFDEINERALEAALKFKDKDKSTQVVAMTMGPEGAQQILRKALSMGADSGVHILDDDLEHADTRLTSETLAAAIRSSGFDLVIAGNESTDGAGGVVPAMVAERLGVPLLGQLADIAINDSSVSGQRQAPEGTLTIRASLPAIATVTERFDEARFPNFKGILSAKRKPVLTISLTELGIERSAHDKKARVSICGIKKSSGRAAGVKIVDDGSGAEALFNFLTAQKLL